jgi:phospholipase C
MSFRTLVHRGTAALLAVGCTFATTACSDTVEPSATDLSRLKHIVVIYLENRSFDNTYGQFDGAEGLSSFSALNAPKQRDLTNVIYTTLPQSDTHFPLTLPNAPFDIAQYVPPGTATRDLVHRYYQEQQQINGNNMDKFAAVSDAQGLSMGYYRTDALPLAVEAKKYTLFDHFFHSAFGGSFLNHIWFIAAAPPVFAAAPSGIKAVVDVNGNLVTDGAVTPDNYVVNTSFSVNAPHPATAPTANLVPNQDMPTIGDRLSGKNITWAWYSGGWTNALAGNPDPLFQFHHQPFVYFTKYADGTQAKADHLKDETDFIAAAQAGTLPAVSFVKPIGINNEHAGYADILTGENHTLALINAVRNGPNWKDAAIIITYDENGGFWDHVAPPKIDRWGPGTRVPAILISPFAKKGFVDKNSYETSSILALIEKRYGLTALSTRDAQAGNMLTAFDFSQ